MRFDVARWRHPPDPGAWWAMDRMPWTTYLWPGLPQLWYGGLWSGLALAVGSAILLNVLLLATFVWVELLPPRFLSYAWYATAGLWLVAAGASAWWRRAGRAASTEAMFREGLHEYLRQNWFEAERILARLLRLDPRDVEARLMLATLLRHTERYQEASDQLAQLELLRDAERWSAEIAAETAEIARIRTSVQPAPPDSTTDTVSATATNRAA